MVSAREQAAERMIEQAGGISSYGNSRTVWDQGERFGIVQPHH